MRSYQYSSYHGYTVPEFPALCPSFPSDLPLHRLNSYSHIETNKHTYTHTLKMKVSFTLRLGVCVWSTVNLMRIVNWRSLGKDSLLEKKRIHIKLPAHRNKKILAS